MTQSRSICWTECYYPTSKMVQEIKEVLRLLMLMAKQNKKRDFENSGGLLVLVWTETDPDVPSLNCTVAAAGPWCARIQMKELHPVFTGLMSRLRLSVSGSSPEPDIEELCAFTDLYGSLNVFLSFPMKYPNTLRAKWQQQIETFFHIFSLTNADIKVHLKLGIHPQKIQQEYRVKEYIRDPLSGPRALSLAVSAKTHHLQSCKNGVRCHGGHPDIGQSLVLSIPHRTMEQGLFGVVSLQLVSLLSPCVLQYPNAGTHLSQMKVLIYSPSNVPVTNPSSFMQNLLTHLNCQELGDHLSFQESGENTCSGCTVYKVDHVDRLESSKESRFFSIDQSLTLFLFLQHTDPFVTDISDIMATEMLLEHHLEDVLIHNRDAVSNAVTNQLQKTLKRQKKKEKDNEKMRSACDVILNSALSIITCSSNMEFRNTCLNNMKVQNTWELSAAISESLRRLILCKFVPNRKCSSVQVGQQPEDSKHSRMDM